MSGRRFWVGHAVLPLLCFAVLAALFETTPLDEALSDPFFDASGSGWSYKNSWWAKDLLHTAGLRLIVLIWLATATCFGLSFGLARLHPWRRASLYLCLSIALASGSVALIKAYSDRSCPWSVSRYGGSAPHLGLLERLPPGAAPGRCFPAGHASGAFSLVALYFVFLERDRRQALLGLAVGLGLGNLYAFGQVARGAHFASHGLWTLAICWAVALGLYRVGFGGRLSR